jgi:hypothetical protein
MTAIKNTLKKAMRTQTFNKVNRKLSRIIAGTDIGLHFHYFGDRNIRRARKTYTPRPNSHPETTRQLKELGYASRPTLYAPALMETIRARFAVGIEDKSLYCHQNNTGYKGPADVNRAFNMPMKVIPELKDLIDDMVVDQMEAYFGSHFQVFRVVCWRNYHVPAQYLSPGVEVYSNNWHFDQRTTDIAKLFVTVSNVTEDDGPFHIISRQRSRQILQMGYGHRKNYGSIPQAELENPKYVVKATGPSGTGLFCNTELCMHRADIPKEGHQRDMVQFQFIPSVTPLAKDWFMNDAINDTRA